MLYLLLDSIVDEENIPHEILKIGYSEKKFSSSRESAYNTHNYGYRLVHEIEGTKEDETNLHKKYKHLLLPGSREWFEYSDNIVDEFYPGFDPENDTLESISPITMKDLEKAYLNDIINPDYLIGTVESIYQRVDLSIDAARYIWRKLIGGESVEDIENHISEKVERTESLIRAYKASGDIVEKDRPGCSIAIAEQLKRVQEADFYWDYVFVSGERSNYEVKFNTGRLKIDQLALEAYKRELEKRKL